MPWNRRSTAERNLLRLARIARWDRPLAGRAERARAWVNMLLADHGLARLVYLNLHPVGRGDLWRSAQPAPHQIARLARRGLRTVVSLRGQREHGSWPLERDACAAAGVALHEIQLHSRAAPSREAVLALRDLYATMDYPALIHCKSGADRAGLAAALYLVFREGVAPAEAMGQLSLRYGHVRYAKTGILGRFFEAYLRANARAPIAFADWVAQAYDPAELQRTHRAGRLAGLIVDRVLRRE